MRVLTFAAMAVSLLGGQEADWALGTLDEVVEFYDRGGRPNPWLDPNVAPLHLSKGEKAALVAFLHS
jgi:hypothetical protein